MHYLLYALYSSRDISRPKYVGKTGDPARRLRRHVYDALRGGETYKDRGIRKEYREGFDVLPRPLAWFATEAECFTAEMYLIAKWRGNLWNTTAGGEGFSGPHSAEHNLAVSVAKKGKSTGPLSEATKAKMSASTKGKPHSAEHNAASGLANRGRKRTAEARHRMRIARLNWLSQKSMSSETRAKMSAATRGRPHSAEHNAAVGLANRGKKRTLASRAKMSAARRAYFSRIR